MNIFLIIEIFFKYENKKEKRLIDINKNERYIKCNTKYNYTIIQILERDEILEDNYLFPDLNYKNGYKFYKDKSVYIINCLKKNELFQGFIFLGTITKIKEAKEFEYYLESKEDLSNSLICLKENLSIMGFHKHKGKKNNINYGSFVSTILEDINNDDTFNKIFFIQDDLLDESIVFENLYKKEYKVIEKIGRGSFGVVYKMEKNNKFYAFKKISTINIAQNEINKIEEKFLILSQINNDYIIKYYYSFFEKDSFNIIMEYVENRNLKQFIRKYKKAKELIEEKTIRAIIEQICICLKEIHKNKIIIGNLTPYNIFINDNNKIKIGDFNISKGFIYQNLFILPKNNIMHYIPTEFELLEKYDYKIDIYSLGCIIYELFSLNEYYIDKIIYGKDCNINKDIYNKKWQKLINLLLIYNLNNKLSIEEIYKEYIQENKIILNIEIKKDSLGKKIFFMDCVVFCLKEMNETNTEIYINDIEYEFKKYFVPEKEGIYNIKIIFNFPISNCSYMFSECNKLKKIDLSSFQTKNVTNMKGMFYNCNNLENIDLSSLNTQNVNDMSFMFYKCERLKDIDLSSFNTQNVSDMSNMFDYCLNLEHINLSSFNINKNTNIIYMFSNCKNLKKIDLSSFQNDFSRVSTNGIFFNCDNLIQIKTNNKFINKIIKDNPDYKNKKFLKNYLN